MNMIGISAPHDAERFRLAIRRRLGLQFDDAKLGFLNEVLQRRLERLGRAAGEYLDWMEDGAAAGELGSLAQELTVTETYFFRNIEQFRAFQEVVVPARMRVRESTRALRFLSAACASGEEAYTLAMVARETILDPSWSVSIRAVDINPAALGKARNGRYLGWALRETPPEMQRKWFRADGRELVIAEAIRGAVGFEARNLALDDPELWPSETYDAVFCRNAIMYFAPEQAARVVERIAGALAPGGYLFLGHAETLRGISDDFHLRHTHDTFYYQRKDARERRSDLPAPALGLPAMAAFPAPAPVAGEAWMETIRRSSERIEALLAPPDRAAAPAPESAPGWDLAGVFELLRHERFDLARARMDGLPPEAGEDSDVRLLNAMLLAHGGGYADAAEMCQRLIETDEFNAGAHYVLALCREGLGDRAGAMDRDRVAIYLDAGFAMPRLHLGLLARRAGERELARRELAQALALLKHEDASRLLLFGGGFGRQALLDMCGAALRECGGAA